MKITTTLARCQTPDGRPMMLQEHDGHYFLKVDGVTLMSTLATASEQQMAELAAEIKPTRILIGGMGFGFTLKRVLELGGDELEVTVAELLPEILAWNREFLEEVNGHLLDDPRVRIFGGDVARCLDQTAAFDVILLDVDNGPDGLVDGGNDSLYGRRGLRRIKSALTPGGRVVLWSAHRDKAFERELARDFREVWSIGAKAYPQAKRFSHTLFVADRS
ncbi:MAG: spermine synthase [Verrucomicrobiales bacterium]